MRLKTIHVMLAVLGCCSSSAIAQQAGNPFESVRSPGEWTIEPRTGNEEVRPVAASNSSVTQAGDSPSVIIGAVNIKSRHGISADVLATSYESFIGREASDETLRDLATSVSTAARDQGYIFASATIPSQSVKIGVVEVLLDPGAIDDVRIVGSTNRQLKKILGQLLRYPARSRIVERQLLLAGDMPGITLLNSSYHHENGMGVLIVSVREEKAKGHLTLDNYGPSTLGPVRARLDLDLTALLTDSDVLTTNVISSALQPEELTYIHARYALTMADGGTVIGLSGAAGRTASGGYLTNFNFTGHNRYASLFMSHALRRSNDLNLWLNGELSYLDVEQSQDAVLFQDDQIVTASVSFSGNYHVGIGRIYGGIGVTQGLGILGASRSGDSLNSRSNGSGEFTTANLWINSILDLGGGYGMRLAGNGQIASEPLLAANEIAIGGPYFGKGFDFSERYGDEGVLGLAELRREFNNVSDWLDWVQLYAFVDGGYVSNIGTGFGDGSLASAGGGLRSQFGKFDFGIEAAAPVNNERFESGDQSPKVNIQLGMRF